MHEVKRRVIDSLGCALGAWNEEPCEIARKVVLDFSATNGATVLGTNHKAPPDWAAFANGCCIRYFDYNDTYLSKEPAHPSDNFAAVFAVAESVGATGRDRSWRRRLLTKCNVVCAMRPAFARAVGIIRLMVRSRLRWPARS